MSYKGELEILVERRDNETLSVSVIDNGCGIAEEYKHRLFEPFFTTKPAGEGSGLGLDIARKIVERIGGSIKFESVPGRTIFTVTLKAAT
jgi:signal transduction histidine kinase